MDSLSYNNEYKRIWTFWCIIDNRGCCTAAKQMYIPTKRHQQRRSEANRGSASFFRQLQQNFTIMHAVVCSIISFTSCHADVTCQTRSGQTCHIQILHVLLIPLLAAGTWQRQIACKIINVHACCFHCCSYISWIIVTLLMTLLLLGLHRMFLPSQWAAWMLCRSE